MESVLTLSDAKARFSEIVEKTINGDEFIVTRMGKPVVRISRFVATGEPSQARRPRGADPNRRGLRRMAARSAGSARDGRGRREVSARHACPALGAGGARTAFTGCARRSAIDRQHPVCQHGLVVGMRDQILHRQARPSSRLLSNCFKRLRGTRYRPLSCGSVCESAHASPRSVRSPSRGAGATGRSDPGHAGSEHCQVRCPRS